MKKAKWIFILLILPFYTLFGQLNKSHNHPRAGDVLIKQQVEFKNPGNAGSNLVWDFSKLKRINEEYTLSYSQPPMEGDSVYIMGNKRFSKDQTVEDGLIIGTEHNTMYYYHLSNDSLLQFGHENPSIKLTYLQPMVHTRYPLNYGQTVTSSYSSEGLYSETVGIKTHGEMITTADAYGKLVLPPSDTLNLVLRIKTIQTIFDSSRNDDLGIQLETCKWYTKGYRYPVFETVRSISLNDNSEISKTAFYYPPQEHLYLDTDAENLAILEEIWNLEGSKEKKITENPELSDNDIISLQKAYPNPVSSLLNIEYTLTKKSDVDMQLVSASGLSVRHIYKGTREEGHYNESLDCSNIQQGIYFLKITAGDQIIDYKIIKR